MRDEYSYHVILLGGTGAKSGEILLHMCANGYFRYKTLNIFYIDSDKKNGNAQKFLGLYKTYTQCREKYVIEGSPINCFFYPKVRLTTADPVGDYKYFKELAVSSGNAQGTTEMARALMETLYSEDELDLKISNGFFAHPNVGAAVFAANMDQVMEKFCLHIITELQQMKRVKIFLLGSIFGGTGASSLPTIARYLKETLFQNSANKNIQEQMKTGGCMVLPYFLFRREDETNGTGQEEKPVIEADKFAVKTKAALEYYKYVDKEEGRKIFDELYILGHDRADVRGNYAIAGVDQRNLPHIVEFYGAMSAVTFFDNDMDISGRYFAVIPDDKITGQNIHRAEKGYSYFIFMMRFAIVMKSLILEELFDHTRKEKLNKDAPKIPWYYDFLNGKKRIEGFESDRLYSIFGDISIFCDEYIRWFAELNLGNIEKLNHLDQIDYRDGNGDVVEYLSIFNKELLFRQYQNVQICNGNYETEDKVAQNKYKVNLEFIRKNLEKLEEVHFYTDAQAEEINMGDIWDRISNMGFSSFIKEDGIFKNIVKSTDPSIESGVKNLVNAVFCACLF